MSPTFLPHLFPVSRPYAGAGGSFAGLSLSSAKLQGPKKKFQGLKKIFRALKFFLAPLYLSGPAEATGRLASHSALAPRNDGVSPCCRPRVPLGVFPSRRRAGLSRPDAKKTRRNPKIPPSEYPEPGSNRHGLPHWCLRPARLPIPPSGLISDTEATLLPPAFLPLFCGAKVMHSFHISKETGQKSDFLFI